MIYSIDPFDCIHKLYQEGGCSIVEVLEYGNIKVVATVGTGEHVKSSRRIVKIFDMALSESNKEVCRIPFETPILSLKITPKRLVIVLECEIHIYNTENRTIVSKNTCCARRIIEKSSNRLYY